MDESLARLRCALFILYYRHRQFSNEMKAQKCKIQWISSFIFSQAVFNIQLSCLASVVEPDWWTWTHFFKSLVSVDLIGLSIAYILHWLIFFTLFMLHATITTYSSTEKRMEIDGNDQIRVEFSYVPFMKSSTIAFASIEYIDMMLIFHL